MKTNRFGLPADPIARRIAMLATLTCAAIAAGAALLILTWIISGDLEAETVAAAAVLFLILAGIVLLALRGGERAALFILSALLYLLVAADLAWYGLHTSMAAAFMIPILLLGCGLGLREGVAAALICSAYGWILAAGENAGWIAVPYTPDISHLTFDAPALTVLYLMAAVIAGYGAGGLNRPESKKRQSTGEAP
jgi:lysylphosphatidylglycerol synthetase-like protein (DUF2156 family)